MLTTGPVPDDGSVYIGTSKKVVCCAVPHDGRRGTGRASFRRDDLRARLWFLDDIEPHGRF
jgi:hypothetical protein